jgi:hypothetical protein
VGRKTAVEALKRRHGRRLLRLPGVSGVGIERGDGDDDYVLVVHVDVDDEKTRAAVSKEVGAATAVRIVKSGPFRKL